MKKDEEFASLPFEVSFDRFLCETWQVFERRIDMEACQIIMLSRFAP